MISSADKGNFLLYYLDLRDKVTKNIKININKKELTFPMGSLICIADLCKANAYAEQRFSFSFIKSPKNWANSLS